MFKNTRLSFVLVIIILITASNSFSQDVVWTKTNAAFWKILKIEQNSTGHLYVETVGAQVHRTLDNGETWEEISFTNKYITDISINSNDIIYLLTVSTDWETTAIYRSEDNGQSWIKANPDSNGLRYLIPKDDKLFSVSHGGKTISSSNQGLNWISAYAQPNETWKLWIDQLGRLYIFNRLERGDERLYFSEDNGSAWVACSRLSWGQPHSLTASLTGFLFVSCFVDEGQLPHHHLLVRSFDNGETWQELNHPNITMANAIYFHVDPFDRLFVFGSPSNRITVSTDHGDTWVSVNSGINDDDRSVTAMCSDDQGNVYIGTEKGTIYHAKFPVPVTPVELTSFKVINQDNGALLTWSTASESKNYGFSIERRTNQKQWKEIGFVSGNGTTTSQQHYTFYDAPETDCEYRLKQIDLDGTFSYSDIVSFEASTPQSYTLHNYPNPFNNSTNISFYIKEQGNVRIDIFNVSGKLIAELINSNLSIGDHTINWDGSSKTGKTVPSGVYFVRLQTKEHSQVIKILLCR